jgi:PHD/YefM family antitoxin component YafN of YafNO toxin-antitoxin module
MSVVKVESTKAKGEFARLPKRARASDVAITRHGRIQAYVLSPDRYQSLVAIAEVGKDSLEKLDDELDALFARMQTASHRKVVHALETLPLSDILAAGALKPRARKRGRRA